MDFFEDLYSPQDDYYDENDEKERERPLASILQAAAAADIPPRGLQNTLDAYPNSASVSADFINKIVASNTVPQLSNQSLADINSWFEDQKNLPARDQSLHDFLRKPVEPIDDLDFFDPKTPANLFPNTADSTGPDDDFWAGLGKRLRQEAPYYRSSDSGQNQSIRGGVTDTWNAEGNGRIGPLAYRDPLRPTYDMGVGSGGAGAAPPPAGYGYTPSVGGGVPYAPPVPPPQAVPLPGPLVWRIVNGVFSMLNNWTKPENPPADSGNVPFYP
jgi:hypothetical protein